jgi:hypothetical protein
VSPEWHQRKAFAEALSEVAAVLIAGAALAAYFALRSPPQPAKASTGVEVAAYVAAGRLAR